MSDSKIALLVDGDNLPGALAGKIWYKAKGLGEPQVRRVYCNDTSWTDWTNAHSFRRIHVPLTKNAADIQLSIDAMSLALAKGMKTFVIASSDGDFSLIAHSLRELGCRVIGMGEDKAPEVFRKACTSFVSLELPSAKLPDARLDRALRAVFKEGDPQSHGILVNQLNGLVHKKDAKVRISDKPEKNWLGYLKARPDLYSLEGSGQDRVARYTGPTP